MLALADTTMTVDMEQLERMLTFWGEWEDANPARVSYDDVPRVHGAVYQAAEPYPDTVQIVNRALHYMNKTTVGQRNRTTIIVHYRRRNLPDELRYGLLQARLRSAGMLAKTKINKDWYYRYLRLAKEGTLDAVQRVLLTSCN